MELQAITTFNLGSRGIMTGSVPTSGDWRKIDFWRPRLQTLVAGQLTAFLLFAPGLAQVTSATSRYLNCWSGYSPWPRLLVVAVAGLALSGWAAVARELAPRLWGFVRDALLLVAGALIGWRLLLVSGVVEGRYWPSYAAAAMIAVTALLGVRVYDWRHANRWDFWQRSMIWFLAPVLPIYWWNVFSYPVYETRHRNTVPTSRLVAWKNSPGKHNMYIFILDEWSSRLSLVNGQVSKELPRLRQASAGMCVFTDAHAAGCHTSASLPRFLFQRTDDYVLYKNKVGFQVSGEFVPTSDLPSLFDTPRKSGYRTYLLGWYHPYPVLLGSRADYIHTSLYHCWLGDDMLSQGLQFAYEGLEDLLGGSQLRAAGLSRGVLGNVAMVRHADTLVAETRRILEDPRSGQFAVFHLPLPHFPFCFGPDGAKSLDQEYSLDSEDLARDQLKYTDRIVGELLDVLRAAGKYEHSTVVITSDHNWRRDPRIRTGSGRDWSQVPLLIKLPGQSEQARIDAPVNLVRLEAMLSAAEAGGWDVERWKREIERLAYDWPVPDDEAELARHRPQVL